MGDGTDVLARVERAWGAAYGGEPVRGAVSFLGTERIEVLRYGPDHAGFHYVTLGMSRRPMGDPAAVLADDVHGPRAELTLSLRSAADSVLRVLAVLASTPAVEGLVLAPDATVDTGAPLWDGAAYTAVLVQAPTLPDVDIEQGREPVRLLPLVPISATELAYRRVHGAAALRDAWREGGIDVTDPLRAHSAG